VWLHAFRWVRAALLISGFVRRPKYGRGSNSRWPRNTLFRFNHIAQSLGYVNGGPFRLEFPELCRAIGKKQAALKRGRLRDAERVLRVALEEDPPPSATELSKRLEYASPNVLRHNFPELYATLLCSWPSLPSRVQKEDTCVFARDTGWGFSSTGSGSVREDRALPQPGVRLLPGVVSGDRGQAPAA